MCGTPSLWKNNLLSVNVEGDLDLGNTLGRWWETGELEVSEELIVPDKLSFTLVHLHLDRCLATDRLVRSARLQAGMNLLGGSRECLALLSWDRSTEKSASHKRSYEQLTFL